MEVRLTKNPRTPKAAALRGIFVIGNSDNDISDGREQLGSPLIGPLGREGLHRGRRKTGKSQKCHSEDA